jgi:Sulphur transport
MTVAIATTGFAISLLCALVMGYAIQRGATCTVAAVGQVFEQGRWDRFAGLMEAALWVAGGLLLARAFGILPDLPAGYAVTVSTLIGGVLLGAGAYTNKACVFGTVAKIGSRDWAYVATPPGFLMGAWVAFRLHAPGSSASNDAISPLASLPSLAFVAFLVFAIWRIFWTTASAKGKWSETIWAPHEATVVIGITFAIMFVAAGAWAYTELLAELALGMPGDILVRLLLLAALFGGSIIAGSATGRAASSPKPRDFFRTFVGGAAMGVGSLLIPGSNDGLILVGMPLLYPYAWVGIGTMCLTIAGALFTERLWSRISSDRHAVG